MRHLSPWGAVLIHILFLNSGCILQRTFTWQVLTDRQENTEVLLSFFDNVCYILNAVDVVGVDGRYEGLCEDLKAIVLF